MSVASRTPEGRPEHCPLCGADFCVEFSVPPGDAPCPACGCLVWASAEFVNFLEKRLEEPPPRLSPETLIADLGTGSLDVVELVMEFEEEFEWEISDEEARGILTVEDVIRWIEKKR